MNTFTKPTFTEQECTLMLGQSIGSNVRSSLGHAYAIATRPKQNNVLYINTVQTDRKLSESVRYVLGTTHMVTGDVSLNESRVMSVLSSETGELHKLKDKIASMIWERGIKTVIINSWDFAADGSRYREKLIYLIKYLTRGNWDEDCLFPFDPVTVLVYAEQPATCPAPEKIQRGGLGKLAGIADGVNIIENDGESEVRCRGGR